MQIEKRQPAAIDKIVDDYLTEYVALDPEGARWAGERRAERAPGGSRRHLGDALIAGVAWRLGATIVTRNPRDFEAYGVPILGYGTD